MIIDSIENISQYAILGKNFETAARFIKNADLAALAPGRVEIDGDRVYAIVSEKQLTQRPENWEVHKRYADIQIIVEGSEIIGYYPMSRYKGPVEFPQGKDAVLFTGLQGLDIALSGGEFVLALPQDMHCPNCPGTTQGTVKKVVVKVLLAD